MNIDITVYFNGFHGDCSETFLVGNVDEAGKRLVKVTHECLMQAMDICKVAHSSVEPLSDPRGRVDSLAFSQPLRSVAFRVFARSWRVHHCIPFITRAAWRPLS